MMNKDDVNEILGKALVALIFIWSLLVLNSYLHDEPPAVAEYHYHSPKQ